MNIDWFTVIAQLLNFILLVWLLKRFLYKPVLNAIEAREQIIKAQLKEAERKEVLAIQEQDEFKKKSLELEGDRSAILYKSEEDAKRIKATILNESREEAALLRLKWKESFLEEKKRLIEEIAFQIQDQVFTLTKKILLDLSSQDLNVKLAEVFVRQLTNMNITNKELLMQAISTNRNTTIVRTGTDLSNEMKLEIVKELKKLKSTLDIQFEKDPTLIGGLELVIDGYKIGWNFRDYISSIQNDSSFRINQTSTVDYKEVN